MPKTRKQKTGVKKKAKTSSQKKNSSPSRRSVNRPLSRSTARKEMSRSGAVDDTVLAAFAAMRTPTAGGKSGREQPAVARTTRPSRRLEMPPLASSMEKNEFRLEDYSDITEERSSILSIVKGLEGQVETAFKLKEVLESELDATQKKLSEELAVRAELEAQINFLETQAALVDQLREDVCFAEEERNKTANLLAEIQPQLESVTSERDLLAKEVASAEANTKEIESEKMTLEAQVMNLKDQVVDIGRLSTELTEITEAREELDSEIRNVSSRLEDTEVSKKALEKELIGAHEETRRVREEVADLREKLRDAGSRAADLRAQLEDQQTINRELVETKTRLESEIKTLNINHETIKKELDTFKKVLRDIRGEATRTSGRVRQRYFKPKNTVLQAGR